MISYSMKWIGLATGIAVGVGLSYYRFSKALGNNSDCKQLNIGKVKQQPSSPPPPSSSPPPPPPPPTPQSPPQPSPAPHKEQQLTVHLVANCITIPNKKIKNVKENSLNEKTHIKLPVKRKINKEKRKQRLNAKICGLVYPKTPLRVFNELFKDIPFHLEQHQVDASHPVISYTATLEVDNKKYFGNHVSKMQSKQKACESFLRNMFANKMSERSEKNEVSSTDVEMEKRENDSILKPKGLPEEDFPWLHFASLAINNLISKWEVKPVVTTAIFVQE